MPLTFEILSRLMVVVAIAVIAVPLVRGSSMGRVWLSVSLSALFIYFGSAIAYPFLSNWHWPEGGAVPVTAAPVGGMQSPDLNALAAAAQASPDAPQGWARLATALISARRPAEAVAPLERVLALTGGANVDWTLMLVDALMMSDDSSRERVNGLVEDALQRDAEHAKALYYGAELAFSRGDLALARTRWQQLLERANSEDTPEAANVRHVLVQRIAQVDQRLGAGDTSGPTSSAPAQESLGPVLTVQVSLDPQRSADVSPDDPVFILARSGAGPPVAVVRRRVGELPFEVTLTDANAMMPTRRLSNFDTVQIVARVSRSGGPTAQPGDVFGQVDVATSRSEPIEISMSSVQP